MKLLLDTHTFWWYYSHSSELSQNAKDTIEGNDFSISYASFWEISIKVSLGKMTLLSPLEVFFQDVSVKGFNLAPIKLSHLLAVSRLNFHHRDPFDRLLIAQALVDDMAIVTKDPLFAAYAQDNPLKIIW